MAAKKLRDGFLDPLPSPEERASDLDLARDYHAKRLELAERWLVPKIADGDIEARRQVLHLAAEAIFECGYFPPRVSLILARGLEQISQDKGDLDAPFGIKRKRGEKRHFQVRASGQRDFNRAFRVECLVHGGTTWEEAIAAIADKDGIPEDTIKGSWKRKHKLAKEEIANQMKWLGRLIAI